MTEKKEKSTKALTKVESKLPAIDIAKIKKLFLPAKATELDVEKFVTIVKTYDLNPFLGEVWCIPFMKWNKDTKQKELSIQIFAARDGFLSIAHKTGMFNGMSTDFGYNKQGALLWAETTVYNKSCEHPIKCKVFLNEYTTGVNLWKTKVHVMLQKVAESTALRRAFNISGLYSPEEFKDEGSNNNNNSTTITPTPLPEPAKQIENVAKALDATIVDDNEGLQRGNFDIAIRNIEGCWDIAKLSRLQKALPQRKWTTEEALFLKDAVGKQEEKIVAQRQEGE